MLSFTRYLGSPSCAVAKVLNCDNVVNEFKHQYRYYIAFQTNTLGKGMNPPYFPSYRLNSTTTVFLQSLGIK